MSGFLPPHVVQRDIPKPEHNGHTSTVKMPTGTSFLPGESVPGAALRLEEPGVLRPGLLQARAQQVSVPILSGVSGFLGRRWPSRPCGAL